jgi:hypothetical protein
MTRDEHVKSILRFVLSKMDANPCDPLWEAIGHVIFILIDEAIADGVRQALHENATPSLN